MNSDEHFSDFNMPFCIMQPTISIRSSRQIKGVYTLTREDIVSARRFEDVIAHGGYPIDVHSPDGKEDVVKDEDNIT